MRTTIFLIAALVIVSCQSPPNESYVLKGELDEQFTGMVYLQDRIAGQMVNVDSAMISNGSFRFKGKLEYPQMLYLRINNVPRISVFMENTEMEFALLQNEPLEYTLSGSESHDIYVRMNELVHPYDDRLRVLSAELRNAEKNGNMQEVERIQEIEKEVNQEKREEVKTFIAAHPKHTVSVFIASRHLVHGTEADELEKVFAIFDPSLSGTRYYDEMEATLNTLKRTSPGQPAIDFTLNTPQGEALSLSDFRGKVVLISFWASWCPYCREENPNLVRVYEKFGGEDFEVLGVSLDREAGAWTRGIKEDGLEWPQVSDLQGWRSGPAAEYGIRSIPQNVLVDQNGIIIARNLEYHELGERLPALLAGV